MRILNNSVLPESTIGATSTQSGSSANNLSNGNLYDYWQPSVTGVQTLTITFPTFTVVDAIGLVGHNLFSAGVTSLTLNLFDSEAGILSTDILPISSDNILFLPITSNNAAMATIDISVGATLPYISSLYLGKSIYTSRSPEFGSELPFLNNQTKVKALKNPYGVVLGAVKTAPAGIKSSVSIKYLPLSWVRSDWVPFVESSMETPFFISLSETIPDPIYATATAKPNPKLSGPNSADIKLSFEGVLG